MAPGSPPEDRSRRRRGEEGIVGPNELDYSDDERVAQIRDGRYVVATDEDGKPQVDGDSPPDREAEEERSLEERGNFAKQQMARYLSDKGAKHGIAVTASFDGRVAQRDRFSDDIATSFGDVVQWYADQVDADAPPEEVLGILLLASDTDVAFPTKVLGPVLRAHGLTTDDSIGDLVEALSGDGLRIPPEGR
ncbi:hypothetical protein SAMN04488063_1322 [Halopelagius inordinatus]|uniref:Uncharacterized protein n=1 Tax=Halopelagius inordinatus TaxID=553467 RepID=A0A1I2NZX7_9EURY|nr:hypothetical protein [Halopelagius inordinatus]SFG06811.1 hypothetical protein SAMN04488063_1322 [Halopelagius inordinatus]